MNGEQLYIPFREDIEQMQADEAHLIDEIVASMGRVNRFMFDKYRHAVRDAHAKIHGALKGELEVYPDLPEHLRQGIFAEQHRFPVMVRLSSAPGELQSDRLAAPLGMAIKVIGVTGKRALPEENGQNQDFLLVNSPVIPFGDVASYARFQKMLEDLTFSAGVRNTGSAGDSEKNKAPLATTGSDRTATIAIPPPNILGESFHSMGALRFGRYVAKISAAPFSASVRSLTGVPIPEGDSAMRDEVSEFFANHSAEYELRAQLLMDIGLMPIEDASILWPESLSPHQVIGKLTFPKQDSYSPARRVYSDDVLSFNPWQCIEAHRPLGSIMRVRVRAYEASSRFRHEMNAQRRVEPVAVEEMPD